jgi:acyl-CoA hydrolase
MIKDATHLICLSLLLAAIAGCSREPAHNPLPDGAVVLAFGDSVTHGTGAGDGRSYPELLAMETGWSVINAGVPGDTAGQAVNRIGSLLDRHAPDLVIVELGGNDFLRQRPERQVKEDLRAILHTCRDAGIRTVLVAVPRLSLLRAGIGALADSPIYRELADEEQVPLIAGVFSDVISDDGLRADRIHPNARGYRELTSGFLRALQDIGLAH